jgi:hypothetical protein
MQIAGLGSNLLMVRPGQRQGPGGGGWRAAIQGGRCRGHPGADRRHCGSGARRPRQRHRRRQRPQLGHHVTAAAMPGSRPATGNWPAVACSKTTNNAPGRPCASSAKRCGANSTAARSARPAWASTCGSSSSHARDRHPGRQRPGGDGRSGRQCGRAAAHLQRRVTGSRKVNTLLISMEDGSDSTRLKASLRQLLRERRKLADSDDDNFNIFDTQQLAETLSGTTQVMTTLLGAVAAVSLLVGGIGIMNIMLVSVTERTREIGLRLAIGALEREVLLQFLIERWPGGAGRGHRHRHRHRRLHRARRVPYLLMELPYSRFDPIDQPAVLPVLGRASAWCSATSRPAAPHRWTRLRRCGTNRIRQSTRRSLHGLCAGERGMAGWCRPGCSLAHRTPRPVSASLPREPWADALQWGHFLWATCCDPLTESKEQECVIDY